MARRLCTALILSLTLHAAAAAGSPPQTKLVAPDAVPEDRVGSSVAASGATVAVGSLWHGHRFPMEGAVFVYRQDPSGTWALEAELLASDARGGENFGVDVAMDGDVLVVGSWGGGADFEGAAYVFRFDGSAWIEEAKLEASDGARHDRFGGSVAVDGDVVAVGAQSAAGRAGHAGAVYVYRFDGGQWREEAKVVASDGAASDFFHEVAIVGDTLLVGAFGADGAEPDEGAAYVYRYDGVGWVEQQKLRSPAPGRYGYFASEVTLTQDFALVSDNGARQAVVFRRGAGALALDSVAADPDPRLTDGSFGVPPVYTGGLLAVGEGLDRQNGSAAGAAWLFRPGPGRWTLDRKLLPNDGAAGDQFGFRIAAACGSLAIGSRYDDARTGAAYLFTDLMRTAPAVDLAPPHATVVAGEPHRVKATVVDEVGRPLQGCDVAFRVTSGPNQGVAGICEPARRCVSSAGGELGFTYVGRGGLGTDTVEACVREWSGRVTCSVVSSVEWRPRPVRIDVSPGDVANAIVPGAQRLVAVAVFGEPDLDMSGAVGLALGPAGAAEVRSETRDLDGDGAPDRIGWFRVGETGVAAGTESLCLRGNTLFGEPFEGCDAIAVPPAVLP